MKSVMAVWGITVLMATAAPSRAATPLQVCRAAKAQAMGKAVAGLLKCAANACKKGTAVDTACETKVRDKMSQGFQKAEAKGGCTGTEDAISAALRMASFTLSLRGDLSVGQSKCTTAKYLTAGKLGGSLAKCRKKAELDGQPLDAACVAAAAAKFACAAAEARGDCLTPAGNCPAVESRVTGFVTCGDGQLDAGEQCDDGNLSEGDGCDGRCRTETQVEANVGAGGSLTTDQGGGATPAAPAQVTVTTPAAGTVSITVGATKIVRRGYRMLERQFHITAPPGTMSAPLVLTFTFDASLVPAGVDENTLVIFRNGVPVAECPGDPCVSNRQHVGDDFVLTVTTTEASDYNAGACTGGTEPCTCPAGMTGTDCKTDIDECETNNGYCGDPSTQGICMNSIGSYTCSCGPGYSLHIVRSNPYIVTCADILECERNPCGDPVNVCTNLPGSYLCSCGAGYTHEFTIDGDTCRDINECATNHGDCAPAQGCFNEPGSHSCADCPFGYTPAPEGEGCRGIQGCDINNGGCRNATDGAGSGPTCRNASFPGYVKCECFRGWWGGATSQPTTTGSPLKSPGPPPCTDSDECALGGCHPLATCTNRPGDFLCDCPPGYSGWGWSGTSPSGLSPVLPLGCYTTSTSTSTTSTSTSSTSTSSTTTTSTSSTTSTSTPLSCGVGSTCVFVSSAVMTGNLGGLAGADATCNTLATAAGLPGTYVAWLSTGAANAIDRLTSNGPYRTRNGDLVANDKTDLTDGAIGSPIDDDEYGAAVDPSGVGPWVWTNTEYEGTRTALTPCSNWTSANQFDTNSGWVGYWGTAGPSWTMVQQTKPCNYPLHLYCFQQ